jgi:RNA polymerase II-associated protein 1
MALRGQRFQLDLDADDFTPIPVAEHQAETSDSTNLIGEIKERDATTVPAPPKPKASRTGFPEHRQRTTVSTFRQQRAHPNDPVPRFSQQENEPSSPPPATQARPSDQAIAHQLGRKHGYDFEAQEKARISEENNRRIAAMSDEDIEEARAELLANLNPALIERLLKRANIDDDDDDDPQKSRPSESQVQDDDHGQPEAMEGQETLDAQHDRHTESEESQLHLHSEPQHEIPTGPSIHFPVPPRPAASFVPLDPNSPAFLSDLKIRPPFPGFKTQPRKKTKSRLTTLRETATPQPSFALISKAQSSRQRKASRYLLTKDSIITASHPRVLATPFPSLRSFPDRHCLTSGVLHIRSSAGYCFV